MDRPLTGSMSRPFTAIICTGGPDAPESVQNWRLARALAERGHAVTLVCDRGRRDLVGRHDGFEVETWPSPVPGSLRDFRFFRRLVRRVASDLVIGNFQSVNVAIPTGRVMGVPYRIAWHRSLSTQTPLDYPRGRALQWVHDRLKTQVLACATHVVPVSPAGRRDAMDTYRVPADRCGVVFHTCRPDPRSLVDEPPRPDPLHRRIASLGRVVPSKGIDVLLRAMRRLRDREPGWPLVLDVVGDGTARNALADLARSLEIEGLVRWHGRLGHSEAFRILSAAHVMALPIRSDPGPGVVPEGLGLGLPLVVSRVGGMADLLADVGGAILFDVDDDRQLAGHLHAILADEALRGRLSTAARQAYLDRFRLDDWVTRVVDWLESTVVSPSPPGHPRPQRRTPP